MTQIPPPLIPDKGEPFVDDEYSKQELSRMDWAEIRSIAAKVESDEINGQSDRSEMEDYLTGHKRV